MVFSKRRFSCEKKNPMLPFQYADPVMMSGLRDLRARIPFHDTSIFRTGSALPTRGVLPQYTFVDPKGIGRPIFPVSNKKKVRKMELADINEDEENKGEAVGPADQVKLDGLSWSIHPGTGGSGDSRRGSTSESSESSNDSRAQSRRSSISSQHFRNEKEAGDGGSKEEGWKGGDPVPGFDDDDDPLKEVKEGEKQMQQLIQSSEEPPPLEVATPGGKKEEKKEEAKQEEKKEEKQEEKKEEKEEEKTEEKGGYTYEQFTAAKLKSNEPLPDELEKKLRNALRGLQQRYQDKKLDSIKGTTHKLVFIALRPEGEGVKAFPITIDKAKELGVPIKKWGDLTDPTPASGVIWDEGENKAVEVPGFLVYDVHDRIVEYIHDGVSRKKPSLSRREIRQIKLPRL